MIEAARDWLKERPALAGIDIALRGDSTQRPLPRARLFTVADPRFSDLDGEADPKGPRIQVDVFATKMQVARTWARTIETELASIVGQTTGGWKIDDMESFGIIDGPPEPSQSAANQPDCRAVLDVKLTGRAV